MRGGPKRVHRSTKHFQKAAASVRKRKQWSVFKDRDFLLLRTVILNAVKYWPDPTSSKFNMGLDTFEIWFVYKRNLCFASYT